MSERDELEAEREAKAARVNEVRAEMLRIIPMARTVFMVAITPDGAMSSQCFFQGFADLRALQVETPERLDEMVMGVRKRVPSQLL